MNICMTAAYDGSRFAGWQKNKNTGKKRALQDIFEQMLSDYFGQAVKVTAAGRTDAGVNALGQVLNFHVRNTERAVRAVAQTGSGGTRTEQGMPRETEPEILRRPEQALLRELNNALPAALESGERGAVAIRSLRIVGERFHSRFDAVGKTYLYLIDEGERPCVFTRSFTFAAGGPLDISVMQEAAAILTGTHDFRAFTSLAERADADCDTVRTITGLSVRRVPAGLHRTPLLCIAVTGNGFLYHMARILAGTLYEIGTGKRSAESAAELLRPGARRSDAGALLPGEALFLKEVFYRGPDSSREPSASGRTNRLPPGQTAPVREVQSALP